MNSFRLHERKKRKIRDDEYDEYLGKIRNNIFDRQYNYLSPVKMFEIMNKSHDDFFLKLRV